MADAREVLRSRKYFKAQDATPPLTLIIESVELKQVGDAGKQEKKFILHFKGHVQTLVLNKGNTQLMVDFYGYESEGWVNKPIILKSETVNFMGKKVPGIIVAKPDDAAPETIQAEEPVESTPESSPVGELVETPVTSRVAQPKAITPAAARGTKAK